MYVAAAAAVQPAGLIRSSQLFPPSLSSRSLEYCAAAQPFHYVDCNYRNFLPLLGAPKRTPHATAILERTWPRLPGPTRLSCAALLVSCPIACSAIPLSNHTSLDPCVQLQSPKWLTLLIDAVCRRRFANAIHL